MRQLKNTNLALVFVDCCQSDVVAQKVNSGDRSNCTMDPSDGNMPLGQDIPDEFNADNGLLLGDYFSNILTAKGIFQKKNVQAVLYNKLFQNHKKAVKKYVERPEKKLCLEKRLKVCVLILKVLNRQRTKVALLTLGGALCHSYF